MGEDERCDRKVRLSMFPKRFFGSVPLFTVVICLCCTLLSSCKSTPPTPNSTSTPTPNSSSPAAPTAASSDGCGTVADCAQKAVEAAQASRDAALQTRIALATLTQQVQGLQSHMNSTTQNYSVPLGGTGATGPGGNGVLQLTNSVSCPAGQYLAGLTLGWAGTCHGSCGEDGGVLHTVTPICKSF
jgi:hypothetical protein